MAVGQNKPKAHINVRRRELSSKRLARWSALATLVVALGCGVVGIITTTVWFETAVLLAISTGLYLGRKRFRGGREARSIGWVRFRVAGTLVGRYEADMLARLRHPNIISGLAAAHAIGVVHRDIKPSNLMVSARGQLTIVDFAIVRLLEDTSPRLTAPSETVGTLLYMSPEQAAGIDVDVARSIFTNGNGGPVTCQWARDGENLPTGTVTAASAHQQVLSASSGNCEVPGPIAPKRPSSSSRPT